MLGARLEVGWPGDRWWGRGEVVAGIVGGKTRGLGPFGGGISAVGTTAAGVFAAWFVVVGLEVTIGGPAAMLVAVLII